MLHKIRDFIYLTIFLAMGFYAQILSPEAMRMQAPNQVLTVLSTGLLFYAFCSYYICEYAPNLIKNKSDVPLFFCIISATVLFYLPFVCYVVFDIQNFDNPFMLFIHDYYSFSLIFISYVACVALLFLKKGKVLESRFAREEREEKERENPQMKD